MVVASPEAPVARPDSTSPRRSGRAGSVAAALLAPLALLGFTAAVFFQELVGGPIAYARDTVVFYYPLTEWLAQELKAGRLPLWLPLIFGGYPLLADGEVGPLYPPNLLLLTWLPMPQAYGWMRALHVSIAALGLFALARVLGVGRFGAFIGGLSFAYGSFMVGHLQHDNIMRTAVWLPWLLLAAERALRQRGRRRALWMLGGALVLAMQSLGVHVQPLLFSLVMLGAYLLVGPLARTHGASTDPPAAQPISAAPVRPSGNGQGTRFRPAAGRSTKGGSVAIRQPGWIRGLRERALLGLGIFSLGTALAAAQLVPLYVLGQSSLRPALASYDYATSYAVSPPQLLTLVFPFMFHFDFPHMFELDAERSWALWSPEESTLYAGVAPLVLAMVALLFVRARLVAFFGAVGLVSLILCMGDYLPLKPYALVWNVPGFSYLRAPARFSLLFELSIACLAAVGADLLVRRARTRQAPRALGPLLLALSLVPLSLAIVMQALRWWLQRDPGPAVEFFRTAYLQTSKENWLLGPWHVYYGVLEFSRPDNIRTALGLLLLATVPVVLRAWLACPRLETVWRGALVGLLAVDLWMFATAFYPQARPEELRPSSPIIGYLQSQPGPVRLLVEPTLNRSLGPNQLVSSQLGTVNGYSSLEPTDLRDYWWSLVGQDNFLVDLFNVGYVASPRRVPGQRTYQGMSYHPSDRLLSGYANNPSGTEQFRAAGAPADALIVVASVERLGQVAAGTPVAEVTLTGPHGEQRSLTLDAHQHLGEYRAAEPGRPSAEYVGPEVAWAGLSFTPNKKSFPVRLYGATLPIDPLFDVSTVTIRSLTSPGRLHVHGVGLRNLQSGVVYSLRASDKTKYHRLYQDDHLVLLENKAALPRAFVVEDAIATEGNAPMVEQLLQRTWDPKQQILVDRQAAWSAPGVTGDDVDTPGQAELLAYDSARVVARADLQQPGYLVLADRHEDGWRAWTQDRELPILRANGIQRAVQLPAGSHEVTFVYDPWWLKLGFAITGLAALVFLASLARLGAPLVLRRLSAARPAG